MRKIFISSLVLLASSSALALDLKEALISAYDSNEDFKTIRQNFLSDIEQFPQALSKFLPDISASASNIDQKSKSQSRLAPGATANEKNTWQRTATLSQSLFNGGADTANLKAAQSLFRASRGTYYDNEQKTILGAIQAYIAYYSAEQKYNISDASVRLNKKQLEAAEEKLSLGEATLTDVASAKANYSSAEATKLKNYTDFQKAKAEFARIFGVEAKDLKLPEVPNKLPASLEELTAKAKAINPAMEVARHSLSAAKAGAFAAKASLLPKVGLSVQAQKNMYDKQDRLTPTLNGLNVSTQLNVTVPIYSNGGAEYSRARQASTKARLAVIGLDNQEKQLNSNCITIWEGFYASKSATEAASAAVEAAQIAYDGIVQEEMVGSKTILEVLDSEVKLLNYKLNKVDTEANFLLTAYQMKALVGELTAKSLKLPVKYFEPEREFKKVKMKIIGF